MSGSIPIKEVKCHLALGFKVKGTIKYFNALNSEAPDFEDLQMELEGDRLHVKTNEEEYFVWSTNLVYAKPFPKTKVELPILPMPPLKVAKKK